MINIKEKSSCTGCAACLSVCPADCIEMKADGEGFLYPEADSAKCIGCNRCDEVCPVTHPDKKSGSAPKCYAAYGTDGEIRKKSSSGGVFAYLAKKITEDGGTVFGAALEKAQDGTLVLRHTMATDEKSLEALLGSKYVQSEIGSALTDAATELGDGKSVLFSGTPCQTAALLSYLAQRKTDTRKLVTVDFACHGVPSPAVWRAYQTEQITKSGSAAKSASFRDKSEGWRKFSMRLGFENGESIKENLRENAMLAAFLNNLCLRPSCHSCAFKGTTRRTDITLADYWGIYNIFPDMYDDGGASAVLVNTEKGERLLESVRASLEIRETSLADILKYNPAIEKSSPKSPAREAFMHDFKPLGVTAAAKKHLAKSKKERFKLSVRTALSDLRCRRIARRNGK